jgi:NADPH:quinone reductase-like Zn-dependent oxidoreductase
MKAVFYSNYGSPNQLKLIEVDRPVPQTGEVLIKTHAASVNSWDWDLLRGKPFIVRLAGGGLSKPKFNILGADVAGVVTAVGGQVTTLKVGDAVFGDLCAARWGGFAEYVCAPAQSLTLKPEALTFEEVAALPQAGVMALQGIRDFKSIHAGHKILINGAGGGVGTYAIQLAKLFNAEVTAVDKADKLQKLTALGADHVIDFAQTDFTKNGLQYDLILDVAANRNIFDYKRALSNDGIYAMIGGSSSTIFQCMLFGKLVSMNGRRQIRILHHQPNKDLKFLADLLANRRIKSVIHKCYALNEAPEALECLGKGDAFGKLIIRPA